MGYMGFGMRKSVYTRKAKKFFRKLREPSRVKRYTGKTTIARKPPEPNQPIPLFPRTKLKIIIIRLLVTGVIVFAISYGFVSIMSNPTTAYDMVDDLESDSHYISINSKPDDMISHDENGNKVVTTYFDYSQKSGTYIFNQSGLLDGQAISYYYSGETFWEAQFENGALLNESFYFKDGQKMKGLQFRNDSITHKVSVEHLNRSIYFNVKNNQIVKGTYWETPIEAD